MKDLDLFLLILTWLSLVIDMTQTLHIKNMPELHEINPILGPHPSDAAILAYFILWMIMVGVAFYFLTTTVFFITSGIILGVEVKTIRDNLKLHMGW